MFRKLISGVAVVVLTAGAGLVATAGGAEAKSARPTLAAPVSVAVGQTYVVTVRPHHKGTVKLQRKVAHGRWHTVAKKKAPHSAGKLRFVRVEHVSGRIAYRAKVAGHYTKVDRVMVLSKTSPPPPPTPKPALFVEVNSSTGDDIMVNDGYTVGMEAVNADGSPMVGLSVTLQRQDPGSTTWTTKGTFVTDSSGAATFSDSSAKRGLVTYRATGGKLSADTLVVIWEDLAMPTAPGNGLAVTKTGSCGSIAPSGDGVDLLLTSVTNGCQVAVNDSVTVTWTFGGNGCTPVQYADFWLDGSAGTKASVAVSIDDVDFSPTTNVLSPGDHSGKLFVDGDPMMKMIVSMTATAGAGGSFVGDLVAPHAMCF